MPHQTASALIVEVPDISVRQQVLWSDETAEAMKYERVQPNTSVGMAER